MTQHNNSEGSNPLTINIRTPSLPDEISITWNIEDVHQAAEMIDIELSDDDCRHVLQLVLDTHDANYGITWDVICNAITDWRDDE